MWRWLYVLAFCWTLPLRAEGKRFVIAVGINQYGDGTWNNLQFASKDAADVYRHFQKWYDGGWLVTDGGEDGKAPKPVRTEDVRAALNRLKEANLSEDDTVVIYISSHGSVGRRVDPATKNFVLDKVVVTNDTKAENPTATGFSHSELLEMFRGLKSRRKALILDSCYSGTGKSKLNARMLALLSKQKSRFFDAPPEDPGEGSIILAASAWGEEAQEYREGRNGLYTYFLLQGFDQGLGRGEAVTLTEAHAFATRAVKNHTRGLQNPTAVIELIGNDPILVKGQANGAKKPIIYAFDWTAKRLRILVDGVDKGSMEQGLIEIPEGMRHITIIEPEKKLVLSDRTLMLQQGQEYSLSHFLMFHPRFGLGLSFRYSQWMDAGTREILGDAAFPLMGLTGTLYDVGGLLDLSWRLEGNSKVRSAFASDGIKVEQELQILASDLTAGRRWRLSILSDFGDSKSLETFIGVRGGMTASSVRRHILAKEFDRDHQLTQKLGATAGINLQTLFHDPRLWIEGSLDLRSTPRLAREHETSHQLLLGLSISRVY